MRGGGFRVWSVSKHGLHPFLPPCNAHAVPLLKRQYLCACPWAGLVLWPALIQRMQHTSDCARLGLVQEACPPLLASAFFREGQLPCCTEAQARMTRWEKHWGPRPVQEVFPSPSAQPIWSHQVSDPASITRSKRAQPGLVQLPTGTKCRCFKEWNFGVVCYAATDKWNSGRMERTVVWYTVWGNLSSISGSAITIT